MHAVIVPDRMADSRNHNAVEAHFSQVRNNIANATPTTLLFEAVQTTKFLKRREHNTGADRRASRHHGSCDPSSQRARRGVDMAHPVAYNKTLEILDRGHSRGLSSLC